MISRLLQPENRQLAKCLLWILATLSGVLLPGLAQAQTYSYDGQRWYEAEVSIFTHEPVPEVFPEIRNLQNLTLDYPQRVTTLRSMSSSLLLSDELFDTRPSNTTGFTEPGSMPEENVTGPEYSPGTSSPVIQDVARDAFTRAGEDSITFSRHNSRLRNASGHRLLFHAVWRFPVKSESETTYVAVNGGGFYSPHYELEGYVGFSLNGNRIDMQADLWLLELTAGTGRGRDTDVVDVPFSPHVLVIDENGLLQEPQTAFLIRDVWQLKELRPMISRQLHYLDHPRIGVIAEVRPYQLPERTTP